MFCVTNSRQELNEFKSSTDCIVVYTATWCRPCGLLIKTLEELSDKYEAIPIIVLDVEKDLDIITENGKPDVTGVPTTIAYTEGKEIKRVSGPMDLSRMEKNFEKLFNKYNGNS